MFYKVLCFMTIDIVHTWPITICWYSFLIDLSHFLLSLSVFILWLLTNEIDWRLKKWWYCHFFSGSKKKRQVEDHSSLSEVQKLSSYPYVDDPSSSVSWDGSNASSSIRSFTRLHREKHSRMSLLKADTAITGIVTNDNRDSDDEFQECSKQIAGQFRKRSRPFSWQRCRKRRHLNSEETNVKASSATSPYKDGLSQGLGVIARLSRPDMVILYFVAMWRYFHSIVFVESLYTWVILEGSPIL